MAVLSDIVSVSITAQTSNPTQAGFGTPLILSNSSSVSGWADRVREYADLTAMALDFATTSAEYKAATKLFSQNPRPPKVLVGKGSLATQRWAVTPVAANSYTYRMTVNGQAVAFTSDASATVTEIIAGLKAAIDALGLAVTVTDQTTYMRIVANTPGAFFSVGTTDFDKVGIAQDHTDPGVAADLAAVNLVRSDWYFLLTCFNSSALIAAAAAWAQANGKFYIAQSQDTAIITTAAPGADIAATLKAAAYDNVALWFSPTTDDFLDAGLTGVVAPYTPGDETWKFKTCAGVPVGSYTSTHRTNARAKLANFYETTQGVNMTEEGVSASGKYSDLVRFLNYLQARVGERVFGRLAALPKVPYTDEGIAVVEAEVRGQLQEDERRGALASGWSVTVPKSSSVSAADKAARTLRNVQFSAVYAGAIHKVLINGSVSA
ncbi:MAG: DUF3383 family protein [Myxococcota bacterium]